MRYAECVRRALLVLVLVACGDSSTTGYGSKGVGDGNQPPPARDDEVLAENDAGILETSSGGAGVTDTDGDGAPDDVDCDPASAALGRRIVEDPLALDQGLFGAPDGFPAESWSFDAAYRQTRLADASDVSFYTSGSDVGDVQIEVRASSTEVGALTPRLRQIFILVGASTVGGTLTAHGCGIEVVEGQTPEQKTSIVKLEGATASVLTTALQRVTRPAVAVNEELAIKVRLEDGAMTCDVTQGGVPPVTTTATANGLGALRGRIGLFTRQTKALFKSVRACNLE